MISMVQLYVYTFESESTPDIPTNCANKVFLKAAVVMWKSHAEQVR